jgi:hypothetical protein
LHTIQPDRGIPGILKIPGLLDVNSDGGYVFRLGAFVSLDNLHRYFLAFVQSLTSIAVNGTEMNEYVLPPFLFNKSKTL